MLSPITRESLDAHLDSLCGRRIYLHMEVTPGCFLRNLAVEVQDLVLRCDGPSYRLALRCAGHGWVVIEGLTHMALPDEATQRHPVSGHVPPLQLGTLVEEDRLTRLILLSEEAYAA